MPTMTQDDEQYHRQRQAEEDAAWGHQEKAKRAALALLGPLGFVDCDDGEFPDHVYHPILGTYPAAFNRGDPRFA